MKIALLADIHGNAIALEEVLKEVKQIKVNKIFILGDFLGYYYDHEKVLKLLASFSWQAIAGNHDQQFKNFVLKRTKLSKAYAFKYGHSLKLALEKLSSKQKRFILSLPEKKELKTGGKKILFCHGAPWDLNEYIYPNADSHLAFDRLFSLNYDFIFLAHTHYPFIKKQKGKIVANVGSVGQPRDKGNLSSWLLLDLKEKILEIRRTKFNPKKIINQVITIDPNKKYLKDVLMRQSPWASQKYLKNFKITFK